MKVVVAGGTGLIGAKVCELLSRSGYVVVGASPSTGIDSCSGRGVADALAGADVVVDVTRPRTWAAADVMDFFLTSTQRLLEAGRAACVQHHLALSVVGTEHLLASGWFRAKIVQESLVRSGPLPHTIVRATQFFEFLPQIADHATVGTIVRLPPVQFQPIAAADVAAAVAALAGGVPAGDIVEIAGPETFVLPDLVQRGLRSADDRRIVVADPQARYFETDVGADTLLPGPGATVGSTRFASWLAQGERRRPR